MCHVFFSGTFLRHLISDPRPFHFLTMFLWQLSATLDNSLGLPGPLPPSVDLYQPILSQVGTALSGGGGGTRPQDLRVCFISQNFHLFCFISHTYWIEGPLSPYTSGLVSRSFPLSIPHLIPVIQLLGIWVWNVLKVLPVLKWSVSPWGQMGKLGWNWDSEYSQAGPVPYPCHPLVLTPMKS